ncbi:MAG: hypothetical protein PHE77_00155 [Candidatus Pacebacteria bacterium]|nr:hypothetical protein [Candidatus Paceibacterota bacterium]
MVDNILKAVDKKAHEQVAKILQEKERAILALEEEYSFAIKAKENLQEELEQRRTVKEVEDFEKMLALRLNFKMQEEKNSIIKAVYQKAQENISNLNDAEFKKLIKHLISYVPKNSKGRIEAGEKTAKVLHSFLNSEIKIEDGLQEEGFIFKSHDIEVDLRISQVLFQLQQTVNPELIKILFL